MYITCSINSQYSIYIYTCYIKQKTYAHLHFFGGLVGTSNLRGCGCLGTTDPPGSWLDRAVAKSRTAEDKAMGNPWFTIMRIWEPQAGAHKNIYFFKKSSLWLSPNLSSKSSFVWLALFLYHVDHPNKHHQQIRLTEQISKSPLVLIRLFWIFTGIY